MARRCYQRHNGKARIGDFLVCFFTRPFYTRGKKMGEIRPNWRKLFETSKTKKTNVCEGEIYFLRVSQYGQKVRSAVSSQVPSTTQPPFRGGAGH
jgi:hypothetical protein